MTVSNRLALHRSGRGHAHKVLPGERAAELLHPPARRQVTQVDGEEAGGIEQLRHRGLGRRVVAGEESDTAGIRRTRVTAMLPVEQFSHNAKE
jgi:hypothetical protein